MQGPGSEQAIVRGRDGVARPGDHAGKQWSIVDLDMALIIQRLALPCLAMHGNPVPDRLISYANHQWRRHIVQQWPQRAGKSKTG